MTTTYEILGPDEATALGAPEELVEDLRPIMDWDGDDRGVFRLVDGCPVELIGQDGGEPEDQTLGRAWSWVVLALRKAYEQGRTDLRAEFAALEGS
jgi:hypothetical protein